MMNKTCKSLLLFCLASFSLAPSVFAGANAWMQHSRRTPAWFTEGVMYQIQPRAFTPEGTLKAAERKLPYLKDLGVTIVYLIPVMKMDESMDKSFWSPRQIRSGFDNPKNQYRIADYFHVDSEYGSDQDLRDFTAAAHKFGMMVLFDLVYLHCGPTAPFLKEHPEFTWWNRDGSVRKGPWRFPQLNFDEPELRKYLEGNVRCLLLDFAADGFRCDVGTGVPLDFWCDIHDTMDALTAGHAVLLCEGFATCNQFKGFDADYESSGLQKISAPDIRAQWMEREKVCPRGSKFANHYESQDIATDRRPRQEVRWGAAATEQVLAWMFTADGIPMLFQGNEIADTDERHSMFGKTPMDWTQLEREPGKSRHAFVKRLAELRRAHPAFTAVNGVDGLTWLDTTAPEKVTAFVRRGKGETILVVQNWTKDDVSCDVSFDVPDNAMVTYIAIEGVDRNVRGKIAEKPLLARKATRTGARSFALGSYGFVIAEVK